MYLLNYFLNVWLTEMKVLQNLKIINLQMMCLLLLPFLEMYNSLGLGE